jgi:hypothetical protein
MLIEYQSFCGGATHCGKRDTAGIARIATQRQWRLGVKWVAKVTEEARDRAGNVRETGRMAHVDNGTRFAGVNPPIWVTIGSINENLATL